MNDLPATKQARELEAVPPKAGGKVEAIVPRNMEELKYVAGLIIGGGIAPDSYKNDAKKIALGIMAGAEVGLPPLAALRNIAIINGRPAIYGDGLAGLVQRSGKVKSVVVQKVGVVPGESDGPEKYKDDFGFEVRVWRTGQDEPYIGRFTVGDAKRAKLWMNPKRAPWMQYPQRMLMIRARTFAYRDAFADSLEGLMVREELEDIPAPVKAADTSFLDETAEDVSGQKVLPPPSDGAEGKEDSDQPAPQAQGEDGDSPVPGDDPAQIVMAAIAAADTRDTLDLIANDPMLDDLKEVDRAAWDRAQAQIAARQREVT
jgi:hypothetical protein